jgi:hypothetical protein
LSPLSCDVLWSQIWKVPQKSIGPSDFDCGKFGFGICLHSISDSEQWRENSVLSRIFVL